jgi:hypothetical protein
MNLKARLTCDDKKVSDEVTGDRGQERATSSWFEVWGA